MTLHNHLLVNGVTDNPPKDTEEMKQWLEALVKDIGMKITMGPLSFYVDKVGNKGVTAIVGIETSHIAIHVWDEPDPSLVQFDLYTCSTLPVQSVLRNLEKNIGLRDYKYMVLERTSDFRVVERDSSSI